MLKLIIVFLLLFGCAKKPPATTISEPVAPTPELVEPEETTFDDLIQEPAVYALPVIYFDLNKFMIREDQQDKMDILMERMGERTCVIEGHTCELGTSEYNHVLGEQRAAVIKSWLVAAGDSSSRLSVISYGEERPATDDESLLELNRRVEVKCE